MSSQVSVEQQGVSGVLGCHAQCYAGKKQRRESKSSLCLLGALIISFCSQYVGEKELYL